MDDFLSIRTKTKNYWNHFRDLSSQVIGKKRKTYERRTVFPTRETKEVIGWLFDMHVSFSPGHPAVSLEEISALL